MSSRARAWVEWSLVLFVVALCGAAVLVNFNLEVHDPSGFLASPIK